MTFWVPPTVLRAVVMAVVRGVPLAVATPAMTSVTVEGPAVAPRAARKLAEAVAVAQLFQGSLGAGSPLPPELRAFLKSEGGK